MEKEQNIIRQVKEKKGWTWLHFSREVDLSPQSLQQMARKENQFLIENLLVKTYLKFRRNIGVDLVDLWEKTKNEEYKQSDGGETIIHNK